MHLPKDDVELFFKLHPALLQYVNEKLGIFPSIRTPQELQDSGKENVVPVRAELWKRPAFINEFVAENPWRFSHDELAIVESWNTHIHADFFIVRHLKKYSVFLTAGEPPRAYGVLSLNTPLAELSFSMPLYVRAVLVPFKKRIVYDGIMEPYTVLFGKGYRFDIEEAYRSAKREPGIIEILNETLA